MSACKILYTVICAFDVHIYYVLYTCVYWAYNTQVVEHRLPLRIWLNRLLWRPPCQLLAVCLTAGHWKLGPQNGNWGTSQGTGKYWEIWDAPPEWMVQKKSEPFVGHWYKVQEHGK